MDKVYFDGTHRCRTPEQTLAAVTPLLGDYGITRLADITGLDTLGVPVVLATRPLAATLTVAQGKGATLDAARASAAMEAIETCIAEFGVPRAACRGPAADLQPGYEITELTDLPGSLVTSRTLLDWIPAVTTAGRGAMVPRDLVRLGRRTAAEWQYHLLTASSNGLASGNTRAEAVAHALHELMERDACARLPGAQQVALDLDTIPDSCADLIARIRAGGGHLQVMPVPSRFGLPCFAARLQVEDVAWPAGGAGAHSDAAVALFRAVTEACQSRLTVIAGSRDDLSPTLYQNPGAPAPPAQPARPGCRPAAWAEVTAGLGWTCPTDDQEAAEAARRVTEVTGAEPLIVDLESRPEFSVVKVLVPRLAFRPAHNLPWPGQTRPDPVPAAAGREPAASEALGS